MRRVSLTLIVTGAILWTPGTVYGKGGGTASGGSSTIGAECKEALGFLASALWNRAKLYTGQATHGLTSEDYAYFERASRGIEPPSTAPEHMAPQTFSLLNLYNNASSPVQTLNRAVAIFQRSKFGKPKREGWDWVIDQWRYIDFLLPFSLPNPKLYRADFIYRKALFYRGKDEYEPTFEQRQFLNEHNLKIDDYIDDLAFHRRAYRSLYLTRASLSLLWKATKIVVVGGVIYQVANNPYITDIQSFDPSDPYGMSEDTDEIEMIPILEPGQATAIRIGGNVYLYTKTSIEVLNLEQFRQRITSLSGVVGSHRRIAFNMSPAKRRELRELISEDMGRVYPSFFPRPKPVYQVNRTLSKVTGIPVPPVINRSQALSTIYFEIPKLFQSQHLGRIIYASQHRTPFRAKMRDGAAAAWETLGVLRAAKSTFTVEPLKEEAEKQLEVKKLNKPVEMGTRKRIKNELIKKNNAQ